MGRPSYVYAARHWPKRCYAAHIFYYTLNSSLFFPFFHAIRLYSTNSLAVSSLSISCPAMQYCVPQLCADCVWQVRISVSRLSRPVSTITFHSLVKQTSENDSSAFCRQTHCLLIRVVSPTIHYVAITLA